MKYLNDINSPADIKKLNISELPALCEEIREYIISETASNPGHLGSSLGVVELAVAIHYVFDTPKDKLVWDVGHQAYAHKIITGRREEFHTNRKYHGISGFPVMKESEYDAFGTGHASTSISAILGMAQAAQLSGDTERSHIAVIGDASIGGGMAFEAINEAGIRNVNMLVILNDNKMAIDDNRSAMSKYLLHITSSPSYNNFKTKVWNFFTSKRKFSNKIALWISNVGNGIKGADTLPRYRELATLLGGKIGCTRPVFDRGVLPFKLVIGQSGVVVKPRLYFAFGVSGAVNHVTGITDSDKVIAINKDPDAAIFHYCDYGIVGDMDEVCDQMIARLHAGKEA